MLNLDSLPPEDAACAEVQAHPQISSCQRRQAAAGRTDAAVVRISRHLPSGEFPGEINGKRRSGCRRHRRRAGGSTVSTLIAQQGYKVRLFEREHFPRFHIGESLIPETYWVLERLNMLDKMQQQPFRQEVQRAVRQRSSGRLSEPFYFRRPQAARMLADLAGRPQRVRPDDAAQRPRAGRRGPRRRPRAGGAVRGRRGPSACAIQEDGTAAEVRAKVVVDASGQSSMLHETG